MRTTKGGSSGKGDPEAVVVSMDSEREVEYEPRLVSPKHRDGDDVAKFVEERNDLVKHVEQMNLGKDCTSFCREERQETAADERKTRTERNEKHKLNRMTDTISTRNKQRRRQLIVVRHTNEGFRAWSNVHPLFLCHQKQPMSSPQRSPRVCVPQAFHRLSSPLTLHWKDAS